MRRLSWRKGARCDDALQLHFRQPTKDPRRFLNQAKMLLQGWGTDVVQKAVILPTRAGAVTFFFQDKQLSTNNLQAVVRSRGVIEIRPELLMHSALLVSKLYLSRAYGSFGGVVLCSFFHPFTHRRWLYVLSTIKETWLYNPLRRGVSNIKEGFQCCRCMFKRTGNGWCAYLWRLVHFGRICEALLQKCSRSY